MTLTGGCHCGNIRVQMITAIPVAHMPVRACQCGFCRAHGTANITDPDGTLGLEFENADQVTFYRFGLRTAEFIICARCGVYVAAVADLPGGLKGTVNVNVLDARAEFAAPEPVAYDGETAAARIARRDAKWTPAVIRGS